MYPYEIFFGLTLYEIFLLAGVLAAMIVFRILSDRSGLDTKLFNFCLADGVVSVIGGYASAVLFQAFYNFGETGVLEIAADTGATFYGGLIGGAAIFLGVYFGIGHFLFRDGLNLKSFFRVAGIAACSITAAHSLGRLGCLMAGCCHGVANDSVFGVYMIYPGYKVLPVQLYESLFLAAICVWFVIRFLRGGKYNLPLYMVTYGVWRFFIEYLRGDDRGATVVGFLSPSQLTALILVAGGAAVWYLEKRFGWHEDGKVQEITSGEKSGAEREPDGNEKND